MTNPKLIAHRALFEGPNKELENSPDQIDLALKDGYDCEIDLYLINSELWLGHDCPQYFITENFLKERSMNLWIHAKNLAALRWLRDTRYNYFWHQDDDFTLTSQGWIWTSPGKELTMASVQVMPEWNFPNLKNIPTNCYAVCSDYVKAIKENVAKIPQK